MIESGLQIFTDTHGYDCTTGSTLGSFDKVLREYSFKIGDCVKQRWAPHICISKSSRQAKSAKLSSKESLESSETKEPSKDVEMTNSDWDVLAFMCWACQDGGECPVELVADTSLEKLLKSCGFTEKMNRCRDSAAWSQKELE